MPLLRQAMYAKGVEVYCAPTVDDRRLWTATMHAHRPRGTVSRALGSCQFITKRRIPRRLLPSGRRTALRETAIRGGSVIIAPYRRGAGRTGLRAGDDPLRGHRPRGRKTRFAPRLRPGRPLRPAGRLRAASRHPCERFRVVRVMRRAANHVGRPRRSTPRLPARASGRHHLFDRSSVRNLMTCPKGDDSPHLT